MNYSRYIYDAMYGAIHFPDYIWEVVSTPELQRLREIRLCNINSLSLTGGANINRFEHALGTCFLALKCCETWLFKKTISENEQKSLLVAALLHDVANSAFGHTIEYVEGYKPESSFFDILFKTKGTGFTSNRATLEVVFFGLRGTLYDVLVNKLKLNTQDLQTISMAIEGKGMFGPLISNSVDLDNIDNVYRMAYHIGIVEKDSTPLKLAQSLIVEQNKLLIDKDRIDLLEHWFHTRQKLYRFLLLNPDEFSGKCMLTEAVENGKAATELPFRWFDSDFDLLRKLSDASAENAVLIPRLMTGDLYGCISIFSTSSIHYYDSFIITSERKKIEKELERIVRDKFPHLRSSLIALHPILDVNKTDRSIEIETTDRKKVTVGYSTKRLLIGVFFKNKDFNMNNLRVDFKGILSLQIEIKKFFSSFLKDENIIQLPLYAEQQD